MKLNNKYDDHKKKKAENEKLRRQQVKESLNKLSESKRKKLVENARSKCRERVRKFREKSKQANQQIQTTESRTNIPANPVQTKLFSSQRAFLQSSYKTEGALAKATTKLSKAVRKSLPKSPSKQDAVLEKFVNSLDDKIREKIINNKTKLNKGGKKGIDKELSEDINQFYERDDVSRVSANTKDARFYKNHTTGEKEMKQKRFLVLTLEQAYNKFLVENAGK